MKIALKIVLGAAACAVMSTGALAADLMAPPAPEAAMTGDWTGGYVGVSTSYAFTPIDRLAQLDAVLGANFQSGMFLAGVEGWLGYAYDLNGFPSSWGVGAEGRVGVVASDTAAIYGGLGVQYYQGGTAYYQLGLGAEFMVSDNVSLDLEYKHWLLSTDTTQTVDSVGASLLWHFK